MQDNARQCLIIFLFALLGACTPDEAPLQIEHGAEEEIAQRSTQAECESLQDSLPQIGGEDACIFIAELLECRLNQGIDESEVIQECDSIGEFSDQLCLNVKDILNNPQTIVDMLQQQVANSTSACPPGSCFPPDPITGCRTIIFRVTSSGATGCSSGECRFLYDAVVYCCN